ncbi:uncharacterized protein [Coffea arabica]|uniref:G-patch domain-containing protein n=1 Tax=Coffea arabica TaxID=13443 RepID=A0ABM4U376_COFAR
MGESSAPVDIKLLKHLDRFDEFMRKSQGLNKQGVLDYDELCLFPDVQLPPNFQQTRHRPPYHQRFFPPNRPTYNYPQPTETYNQNRIRTFTNLGRPLDQSYEQLKAAGKIGVIPPPTYPYGMPAGYNPQATCAYHSGAPGHSTANCRLLKHKIQDMLEAGEIIIRKREEQGPNVSKNPLPEHPDMVSVIMDDKEFEELVRSMSNETEVFGVMDQPFVIEEVSYEGDKKPFILDRTPSKSAALEPVILEFPEQVPVFSLRSGKIANSSTAGVPVKISNHEPTAKPAVTEKEAWDVLKRLKRHEYNVVEQLNKMPAQISILDLLFSSDLHRDALLEVLTKARIPKDISVDNFSHIVGNVLTAKQITFSDEELPAEGTGHNKALYVAMRCNGKMLPKVLIDNRSALNICPWSTLVKLGLQDVKLKPSETVVREFDGAQRESIGEVNLVVEMGPAQFLIACQVMHFPSVYNVLLGWPRIHSSGAVPSSLHQVLKCVVNDQLITIFAEEDCIVIADSEPEEDGNRNASVSSYRTADIVSVSWITSEASKDEMVLPVASVMMAKEMIRGGYEFDKGLGRNLQGILKPVELIEKKDLFGLGFCPTARDIKEMKAHKRAEKEGKIGVLDIPPLRYTFPKPDEVITSEFNPIDEVETSLTHLFVGAISEDGSSDDAEFPNIPKGAIHNWTAEYFPVRKEFRLPIDPTFPPVKQRPRKFKPDMSLKIKEQIEKQLKTNIIIVSHYPVWLSNPVPVPKKNGEVRVCVDYRDLNKASPKDDFPLPNIHIILDNTAGHEIESFCDCFVGYHQILMVEEDREKTAFITPWGTFCYRVMPGLKNGEATYQRTMTTLFHDMIHKEMEVYVDDIIIKSKKAENHLIDLRKLFERLRKYNLKLNPAKCAFGAPAGKLLGFIVSKKGIEIDLAKIKAVKGQAIADHLAENPNDDDYQLLHTYFPDEEVFLVGAAEDMNEPCPEWRLFFDGAANSFGAGIGAVLVSPDGKHYPGAAKLQFPCTNNMAEYEAYIFCLKMALEMEVKELIAFSDSDLLVHQTLKQWITKDSKILPYHCNLLNLAKEFQSLEFRHLPRARNIFADALATLSSMIQYPDELRIEPIWIQLQDKPAHYWVVNKTSGNSPWYNDIKEFIKTGSYPPEASANDKGFLRRMASKFFLNGEGMDVIGTIDPPASNGHQFILVATEYFTKWVEAESFKHVTKKVVASFLRDHIICRFGVPETLITDNAKNLNNERMNEAVEAANKNLKKIIRKMTKKYHDWHEKLSYALMAYRTSIRTSTGATPYSLMYGMEAVLPAEVEIPSLHILTETKLEEADWLKQRYEQLSLIDEKRLNAICHGQCYQKRMARAYNKKVHRRTFEEGDKVLKRILPVQDEAKGKFAPNWQGPFIVQKFNGYTMYAFTQSCLLVLSNRMTGSLGKAAEA